MKMTRFRQGLLTGLVTTILVFASQSTVADDVEWATRMCSVIDGMGGEAKCAVTSSEYAVDVTIDTTVVDAAKFCATFSEMLDAMASMLSTDWKMRVFSNDSPDSPAAICDLG